MGRAPCCEKVGLNRGRWTAEEDDILTKYIQANGEGKWSCLPKNAGLLRCGKSCRLRWVNYLKSDLKRGKFSTHEDETIIKLHSSLGNRWCLIASHLPGRTDNEIKNYWNSHLSRKLYNYRKIIQELKQQEVVVEQPLKSRSTNIAPKTRVIRTCKSATKKKKSKFPTKLGNPAPKKLEVTSSSQEVDNGAGTGILPAMDDISLDSDDFSNIVFDGLVVCPAEAPNFQMSNQPGDKNGEIMLTSDDVENWLMGDNVTVQSKNELNICNGGAPSLYLNDEFDALGEDWDNLNLNDKVEQFEEETLLSWLSEINYDKANDGDCISTNLQRESDTDKQNATLENNVNPNLCINYELDTLEWDCGSLDLQGEKSWNSEEHKSSSWRWDSISDDFDWISATLQSEADGEHKPSCNI
ncbi:uncharacterized protein LOC141697996 [Apium graveolens]|uniref:uncharacterized protein LOC141697996 n=1 Tax=Apium graveolens TaxID=4045 RepID=UPI003D791335